MLPRPPSWLRAFTLCGFSKALAPWKAAAKGSDVWSPFTGQSLDVFTGFMLHVDNKLKSNQLLVDIWCLRADCAAEHYETLSRWTGVKAAVMPNKAWKWGCRFSSLAGADDPCAIRLLQRPGCESAPGCFLLSLSLPAFVLNLNCPVLIKGKKPNKKRGKGCWCIAVVCVCALSLKKLENYNKMLWKAWASCLVNDDIGFNQQDN